LLWILRKIRTVLFGSALHQNARESRFAAVSLGIYIHIPFCRSRCNYCHFVCMQYDRETANRYQEAVRREIELFSSSRTAAQVDSIYFGGGTPSLVPAEHISGILAECRRSFTLAEDSEVSLEANPDTINAEDLSVIRSAGVNRISLGAQSFSDRELAAIGRIHSSGKILESLKQLRYGAFENINLDLILGLPHQTSESWRQNLQEAVRLSVPHISVYMLDLDEESALSELVATGSIELPAEDLVSDLYLYTIDFLSSCGYLQYEISNFAKPGYECLHNLKYWKRQQVQGFGLASHSFDGDSRYANKSGIQEYFQAIEAGDIPLNWRQPVTPEQAMQEKLFLGLRLREGVDWSLLSGTYGHKRLSQLENFLQDLSKEGFIEWNGSVVRLTSTGMLLSNEIFQEFI
jgi:oxygen-independent coproporphyrinogen-3 oxidase